MRYASVMMIAFAGLWNLTLCAQVGVNQLDPQATLDIRKSDNFATEKGREGVLIPRLTYTELKEMTEARYSELEESHLVYVKEKTASESESSYFYYKKAMERVGKQGFYYWLKSDHKWYRISDKPSREKPLITSVATRNDIRNELNSGKVLRGTYGTVQKNSNGTNYTYTGLIRIISQLTWTTKDSEKIILKPRQEETTYNFHNGQTLYVENMPLLPIFLKDVYSYDDPNRDMEYRVEKKYINPNDGNEIVVGYGKLIFTNSRIHIERSVYQPFYLFAGRQNYTRSGFYGIFDWDNSGYHSTNTLDEKWDLLISKLNSPYGNTYDISLINSLFAVELLPILITEDSDIKL